MISNLSNKITLLCAITFFNLLAQNESAKLITTVNYVSAENVYLKSGLTEGVQIGDKFTIFRNEQVVGYVEVVYVAQNSASCKVLDKTDNFLKNDKAVRTFTLKKKETVPDTLIQKRKRQITQFKRSKRISMPLAKLSGSVSMQWYQYQDADQDELSFSQPTLRLNFKARKLWGENYNFYIKLRSRYYNRSERFRTSALNEKLINRIYTLGFEFIDEKSPMNFKIGRIISTKFSGIGYFDGIMLQYNFPKNFKLGIFGGAKPQWQYSDFQTSLQKYGLFLNYSEGDYNALRFESTLAAAGEYHDGTISREFVYFQNRVSYRSKWHIYQSAGIDINRYWRKDISGESISISSVYLSGRYRFSNFFTAGLSFDNRKNYLTYEVKTIAEELFDDALRQGLRANVSISFPKQTRLFANFGLRKKEDQSETTYSYHVSLSKSNLIIRNLRGSINFAGFSNLYTTGYNPSVRLSHYFNSGHSFNLKAGSYFYSLIEGEEKRSNYWAGMDSYFYLLKKVFLITNYEYNWGDDSEGHRILAELGYRF